MVPLLIIVSVSVFIFAFKGLGKSIHENCLNFFLFSRMEYRNWKQAALIYGYLVSSDLSIEKLSKKTILKCYMRY